MLLGYLDNVDASHISGWARDTEDPSRRVALEVYDGDRCIMRIVADRLRSDLAASGVGDGHYGFWVPMPREMFPLAFHLLSVRFSDNGVDLRNSPRPIYPREGGVDSAFEDWFSRHISNAAAAAAEPGQISPLVALCANALSQLLQAEARLQEASGSVSMAGVDQSELPSRLKRALERAFAHCPPLHVPIYRTPKLSIIVAGNGNLIENYACLKSIVASRRLRDYEVIFVDVTGTTDMALAPFIVKGGIRFVKTPQSAPILEAYRAGLALSSGSRLLFLGHVASVEPDAILALSTTLDLHDGNAIVSPRLVAGNGRIVEAGSRYGAMAARLPIGYLEPAESSPHQMLAASADASPRAFMIDRSLFEAMGQFSGMDEFGDFGIADLAFRLRERGAAVLMQGYAGVTLAGAVETSRPNRMGRSNFTTKWQRVLPASGEAPPSPKPKRMLVIDERLPDPTRDAASVAVLSHCQGFLRLGYKVEFVPIIADTKTQEGGAHLLLRGIEAHVAAESAGSLLQSRAEQFDVVYIHRFSVAKALMSLCRSTQPSARIIYNVADLHFLRQRRQAEIDGNATALAESNILEAEERACIMAADAVITHSSTEEAWLREACVQTMVGRVLWQHGINTHPPSFEVRRNFAFIGAYGHPPNADAVNHFLAAMWPSIQQRIEGARFEIAGSNIELAEFNTDHPEVVVKGYVADARAYLSTIRVMLAPLRFGAGVKGKVLLSLAEGVPCVMTEIAAEGLNLPYALRDLLVAKDEAIFIKKAIRFHTDAGVWNKASLLARDWASSNLSPAAIDQALALVVARPQPSAS